MSEKEYKGSVYIAVVGSENEPGICRDSIEAIVRRKSDTPPQFIRATKGYEARQMHLNNWYAKTKHPFILFLDHDMLFPEHTLEKLRANKKPFVSGFYMRRAIRPASPVWFERGEKGVMPMKPMTALLEANTLYPLGASGWGCMLLHRDVVTAVRKLLKGENEIIEDDMDMYPYDLKKLIRARNLILGISKGKPVNEKQVQFIMETFVNEIRPLRGIKDEIVGSDIRFPFYAHLAGFPLFGDTGVCCEHVTNYPLSIHDWLGQAAGSVRDIALAINKEDAKEREKIRKAIA